MQILKYEDRDAWMAGRRAKITGSRVKSIVVKRGTAQKKGYYELIAERLAIEPDNENVMDRGNRLEDVAIARFTQKTGKEVDTTLVIWERDDNSNIAVSPDGVVKDTDDKEACEVKCLNSASHIEAFLTKEVPAEYKEQVIQYFVVNEELEKLYFIFYDPRMTVKDLFFFEITRESLSGEITEQLEYERNVLVEVEKVVKELTF